MNKDEILKRSRNENKGQDEMENENKGQDEMECDHGDDGTVEILKAQKKG